MSSSAQRRNNYRGGKRSQHKDFRHRPGHGADSPNWRDHGEVATESPPPPARVADDRSVHQKRIDYLSKEWKEVEQQLREGRAVRFDLGSEPAEDLPRLDLTEWLLNNSK